jgi:hypothetical protein
VTADGQQVLSASDDKTLKVWHLESELPVATFHCDVGVMCCAIARACMIIAGDGGGRAHFLALEERGGTETREVLHRC